MPGGAGTAPGGAAPAGPPAPGIPGMGAGAPGPPGPIGAGPPPAFFTPRRALRSLTLEPPGLLFSAKGPLRLPVDRRKRLDW